MAKLIGTAGHVDHGKTTLIKALTGIDADRLPEEKARGMTIDIGFAYIDVPEIGRVSIVDVPGHEKFVSNMLVGALGIDVALLCVAADEGVKPQTLEHFQILELLPVTAMVVALTRSDLADAETVELAQLQVADLLAKSKFAEAKVVPVSAQTGLGMDSLKEEIVNLLKQTETPQTTGSWYMPIDRVFTVKGHGCVVTGTLARGKVKVGDPAVLEPGNREVRIRTMHWHGDEVQMAVPGQRTAFNLGGVKEEEVERGQTIGAPGATFETTCLDARLRWVQSCKYGERVRVSIGAAEVIGKAYQSPTDPDLVQLRLHGPVAVALGQPLIVRRHSPPDLLGGGVVEVPLAKQRKRTETIRRAAGSDLDSLILGVIEAHPNGVETAEVCRQLGRTPQELGNTFESLVKGGKLIGLAGLWLTRGNWENCARLILSALEELHEKQPSAPWLPREVVMKMTKLPWIGKPLDRAVALLATENRIEMQGTGMRLPTFRVRLTDRQRSFLDRVKAELETQVATTYNAHQLSQNLHVPMPAVEEILKLGQLAGEVVLLEEGVIYTLGQIEQIKARLRELSPGKPFTAGQARDFLGASRKYIIPLLEYLDRIQFTLRVGDQRAIRGE